MARVALAGNPNTGKTALFNRLTGQRGQVGNYAGVTVERREADLVLGEGAVRLIDVPGTYSLSARSPDEEIAMRTLAGLDADDAPPDAVVVVVDGTQLERNLYLALQVIELDVPVIVAVNMADSLTSQGAVVNTEQLSAELGVAVVLVSALRGTGIDRLRTELEVVLQDPSRGRPGWRAVPSDPALLAQLDRLGEQLPAAWTEGDHEPGGGENRRRALALWALLSIDEDDELLSVTQALRTEVRTVGASLGRDPGEIDQTVIEARYGWIEERMPRFLTTKDKPARSLTGRLDAVLLSPWIGFPLFLLAMTIVFESLFAWSDPAIGAIEDLFGWFGTQVAAIVPDGLVQSFLVDGLLAGVGGVLVFVPQIALLFLLVGLMEQSGYMARVAYLMDRVMRLAGLNGRAFVPMLSGFACAIPAVMATRTMERQRDRILTMMVVPLMSCSARLPVYTLLIAAMVPVGGESNWSRGKLLAGMYVFSTLTAIACATVLGKTLLRGPKVPLLLELPPYRLPNFRSLFTTVFERSMQFVRGAGGIILVCTVILWFLLSFPRQDPANLPPSEPETELVSTSELASNALHNSYAGRLGQAFEPAIEPLGFDWKIGIGLIGAFAAREVFVSTMAVVYGLEDDEDEHSVRLRERLAAQTRPDGTATFTPLVCFSLMVFFALACQCMSTLAAVQRETGGWRWPTFLFAYMTALAWLASFAVYQGGKLLGFA